LFAAACSPAQAPASGSAPAPAQQQLDANQTFVWASGTQMPTLHPFVTAAGTQRRYDIYDMLVSLSADGKPEPMIATEWKLLDDKTWQFKIRTDVKFHDGTPVTAEDVRFSYDTAKDPSRKYSITTRAKTFDKAEVVDATIVNIKTKDPDPIFLRRAALISILPKAYLEKVGDDEFGQKPIGSGPFKVKEFVHDDHLILTGVPEHAFRKPTLTQATIKYITDASARMNGMRTGDIDFVENWPIQSVKPASVAGLSLISITAGLSRGMWVDTVVKDKPTTAPTRDKRVRQAMNYALDKDAIVKNIYGGQTSVEQCQVIQPETFGYNPNLKAYLYDPAKAKQLLTEAGAVGAKLRLEAQLSQLNAVGFNVELVTLGDYAVFRDKFYGDQPRGEIFPPGLNNKPLMDADGALTWFSSDQPLGARHYDNAEFDDLYHKSMVEMNEQKRLEYLQKALAVFCEDPPYLFTVQAVQTWAFTPKMIGFERRVDGEPRLDQLKRIK
jgi:peptide/nickel transport system substrate-binding protein